MFDDLASCPADPGDYLIPGQVAVDGERLTPIEAVDRESCEGQGAQQARAALGVEVRPPRDWRWHHEQGRRERAVGTWKTKEARDAAGGENGGRGVVVIQC